MATKLRSGESAGRDDVDLRAETPGSGEARIDGHRGRAEGLGELDVHEALRAVSISSIQGAAPLGKGQIGERPDDTGHESGGDQQVA